LLNKESGTGAATLELNVTVTPACSDGVDSDGDTLVDYPADGGCRATNDDTEIEDCRDGVDNDLDGRTDYPADLQCTSPTHGTERPPPRRCGLLGIESFAPLALLLLARRLRRRTARET
jgi:hypothetical protein